MVTDASGNFITSGLPSGTYYVSTDNSLGLVDYLWNNLVCAGGFCNQTQGTPISVTVPSTTSGINFVLTAGQDDFRNGDRRSGWCAACETYLSIWSNSSGAFVGGAITDAIWHVHDRSRPALEPTTRHVSANGYVHAALQPHLVPDSCPPTNGTPIVVSNQPVTNINFSLLATGTGSITGTVTDGFNGNLPTGLSVQLVMPSGEVVATTTPTAGVYTFSNVATGSYYVRTNAPAERHPVTSTSCTTA